MGTLTIYGTQGNQIEPEAETEVRAEGRLAAHINNSVDLFLDPASNRVVAYVRARVSGSRPNHYHAEYVGEDGENLIAGLLDRLRALADDDDPTGDHEWTLLRDRDRFNLAWWTVELQDPSLDDLGVDLRKRLAIDQLLEEGTDLDFGVAGYRAAATALGYYARRSGETPSIGVSSGGRIGPVQSVDLVLAPGEYEGLTPLTEGTEAALRSKQDDIEELVRQDYESRALDAVEKLSATDELSAWQLHQDLTALETYLSSLWTDDPQSVEVRSDAAERVAETVTGLQHEGRTGELPDPRMLDAEAKVGVRDRVLERLAEERDRLEDELPERVRGEFDAATDDLTSNTITTVTHSIEALLDVFDGHRESVPESCPKPAHRIVDRLRELEANTALPARERDEIRSEVEAELTETLEALKEHKRSQFLDRFDRCLEQVELADVRDDDLVSSIRRTVERDESVDRDSDLLTRFASVVDDVESADVFTDDERRDLRSEFLGRVEDRVAQLRASRETTLKEQLEAQLDEIEQRSGNEPIDAVYERLWTAKQQCTLDPNREIDDPAVRKFATLVARLNQDEVITQNRKSEIRAELDERIASELDRIERDKREADVERVEDELDRVVPAMRTELGEQTTFERLEALRQYVNGDRDRLDERRFAPIVSVVDELDDAESGVLDVEDIREARAEIRSRIEDRQAEIRREEKDRLASDLESAVEELLDHSGISARTRLEILDRIHSFWTEKGGNHSTSWQAVAVEVDQRHETSVASLYDRITDDLEQVRNRRKRTILTDEQRRTLKNEHFESTLADAIDRAKAEYRDAVAEQFEGVVMDAVAGLNRYESDLDRVREDLETLEATKALLEGSTRRGGSAVPDRLREFVEEFRTDDLLHPDEEKQLREQLLAVLKELIEERRDLETELQEGTFRDLLEDFQEEDLDTSERLVALFQFERLLQETGETVEQEYIRNPQVLRERRESLAEETRLDLVEEVAGIRAEIADEYAAVVIDDIGTSLENYVADTGDNVDTNQGLESFNQFLSGSEFDPQIAQLIAAKDQFEQARSLHATGALPNGEYEEIQEALHEKTEALKTNASASGGRLGGVSSKLSAVVPSVGFPDRKTLATFGAGVAVGVVLTAAAVVLTVGLAGIGPVLALSGAVVARPVPEAVEAPGGDASE
ncbi:hypothetical protein [Haloparvum sedimenti]|uniref:hypothetical protein n=1 Tax=Haloparvum sedimenti TaxID=1678448 RepID=UPI00071E8E01|nr:hypothetical protein [Haloparvum sedimenti]